MSIVETKFGRGGGTYGCGGELKGDEFWVDSQA